MQKGEVEKYDKFLTQVALPWLEETDDVQWERHCGTDIHEGVVFRGQVPKYGTIWKSQVVMDCSAEAAYNAVVIEQKNDWFPNLAMDKIIEEHDGWHVAYQVAKGQSGISDREFYTIRFRREYSQGFFAQIACSVADPPKYNFTSPYKKIVRGENLPGGMSWKQLDDPNKCLWTYVYNVDLKGFIPRSLVNLVVANFLFNFAKNALDFSRTLRETQSITSSCKDSHRHGSKMASERHTHQHLISVGEQ